MSNHNIAPQPVPSSPQQYQPQQPQPQPPQPQHLHTTICGIAAVVFGALGLVLSFIPIVNNIAAILGFIGVILAIIAIVGTFRGKKRGKVLSIVAAVLSVVLVVAVLSEPPQATRPAAITHAIAIAIKRFIFILSYSLFFSIHSNESHPVSPLL